MLSTESDTTVSHKSGRSAKYDGTDIVQKTVRVNLSGGCLLVLSYATGPPTVDTLCHGPKNGRAGSAAPRIEE